MSQRTDEAHARREAALDTLPRNPQHWPQEGRRTLGPLRSVCCDAREAGGIWLRGEAMTGTCSKCYDSATFTERPL